MVTVPAWRSRCPHSAMGAYALRTKWCESFGFPPTSRVLQEGPCHSAARQPHGQDAGERLHTGFVPHLKQT